MGKSKGTSNTDSKPTKAAAVPVVEKAKSSKTVKATGTIAKEASLVTKKSKVSAEIDDLFCSVAKKSTKKAAEPDPEDEPLPVKAKHRSSKEAAYGVMKSTYGGDIINPEAPLERIDAESGLPVYKAHLLKVGEGGGTELCPFDCNCCF